MLPLILLWLWAHPVAVAVATELEHIGLVAAMVAAIAFVIRDEKRANSFEIVAANFHERLAALETRWQYLVEAQAFVELAARVEALEAKAEKPTTRGKSGSR